MVSFDEGAVRDFESVKNRAERRAILTATDKLRQLGPDLGMPHAKSLSGEPDLSELRPRQGQSATRPIFVRRGDQYVVMAIALDHAKDMQTAISDARKRLKAWDV